jgi:cytochrome oxidase Cu insertion factor (SCO1/SenC/PrrC family)
MSDERRASRARLSLLLIAAVAAAPLVAAYALFHFWRPSAFTNYGQLLPPDRIADVSIRQADGSDFTLAALKGKWVLMMVDSGICDAFCRRKLYQMRQVRLTQGKDMERIERAWLVDDEARPASELVTEYLGTRVVSARGSPLLSRLPADVSVRDHIYIVDPLGNLMMRYPRDADPSRIKKDVTRLLKVSGIG